MASSSSMTDCTLYTILFAVHLSASGGQVYSSIVLADGTNSYVFSFLMVTTGAILILILALLLDYYSFVDTVRVILKKKKHLYGIIGLGLNSAMKYVCFVLALSYVEALNAAVYIPLIPITAMVITRVLGWESGFDVRQGIGIVIAISGAILVTVMRYKSESSDSTDSNVSEVILGNCLLVVWNFNVAAAIVLQKPLLKHYSPVNLSACVISVSSLTLATFVPFIEYKTSRWDLSGLSWGAVVYCGIYLAFMSYGDALGVTMIPASTVAMLLVSEPIFTAIISYIVSGDTMTLWEYIGSGMTIFGLMVVLYFTTSNDGQNTINSTHEITASGNYSNGGDSSRSTKNRSNSEVNNGGGGERYDGRWESGESVDVLSEVSSLLPKSQLPA